MRATVFEPEMQEMAHDNMRRLVYLPFQPSPAGLLCDRVSVHSIVEATGTPTYVYSAQAIRNAFGEIDSASVSTRTPSITRSKPTRL
jgi:hypothetical protein